jgi:MoxR-like ATPase
MIGDRQVRAMGTIGGSLANNDPAADYPAAALGLGATITTNKRKLAADEFFKGMFETALQPGEVITSVSFPIPRRAGYTKFKNQASRFALVGVFVTDSASGTRVAVTGAGPSVFRQKDMEKALSAKFDPSSVASVKQKADGPEQRFARERRVSRASRRRHGQARSGGGRQVAGSAPGKRPASAGLFVWVAKRSHFAENSTMPRPLPKNIDDTHTLLSGGDYVADRSLATALYLALRMQRPLFLEGEAGVGKTEIAKVVADSLGRELIRLQCYEGLDIAQAAYEWNYSRQMIEIRLSEAAGEKSKEKLSQDIFSEKFLVKRPLARALEGKKGAAPVLLIDELDRTDEPFEAYLLEVLSDWQISIPEIGTLRAAEPPIVVITSNRTREIHDAVKRRCFYYWVDYPDAARELEILRRKAPRASAALSKEVVAFVQRLRTVDLFKLPGVAETIDWANCLVALDRIALDPETSTTRSACCSSTRTTSRAWQGEETERLVSEAKAAGDRGLMGPR